MSGSSLLETLCQQDDSDESHLTQALQQLIAGGPGVIRHDGIPFAFSAVRIDRCAYHYIAMNEEIPFDGVVGSGDAAFLDIWVAVTIPVSFWLVLAPRNTNLVELKQQHTGLMQQIIGDILCTAIGSPVDRMTKLCDRGVLVMDLFAPLPSMGTADAVDASTLMCYRSLAEGTFDTRPVPELASVVHHQ
jgi:hypothetical protein